MLVRFLEDAEIRDHAGAVRESYRAGETHDLRKDKAQRWLKRSKAVRVREQEPVPAAIDLSAPAVEIPADWRKLHWTKQCALASALLGQEVAKAAEARDVIEAEERRRADANTFHAADIPPRETVTVTEGVGGPGAVDADGFGRFVSAQDAYRDKALKSDE